MSAVAAQRIDGIGVRSGRASESPLQASDRSELSAAGVDQPKDLSRLVYLTMDEAAEHARYTGKNAANSCYRWLRKHGVHLLRRGNYRLVRRADIDRLLEDGASDLVTRARDVQRRRGQR